MRFRGQTAPAPNAAMAAPPKMNAARTRSTGAAHRTNFWLLLIASPMFARRLDDDDLSQARILFSHWFPSVSVCTQLPTKSPAHSIAAAKIR